MECSRGAAAVVPIIKSCGPEDDDSSKCVFTSNSITNFPWVFGCRHCTILCRAKWGLTLWKFLGHVINPKYCLIPIIYMWFSGQELSYKWKGCEFESWPPFFVWRITWPPLTFGSRSAADCQSWPKWINKMVFPNSGGWWWLFLYYSVIIYYPT